MTKQTITALTVFCGSRTGNDDGFKSLAVDLGKSLAEKKIRLVYGGGSIGLMGLLADAQMAAGGEVTGVIPRFLEELEVGKCDVTELIRVTSMHERKALMAEEGDAFLALPGGIGTLDELVEVLTWRQLQLIDKPVFLLDYKDYWQPFMDMLAHMEARGFIGADTFEHLEIVPDLPTLLHKL